MARTRLVKPGIFRNEYLWECEPLARYFWIGLWCHADYRGVVEWRPKRLKADILPCDDCDVALILLKCLFYDSVQFRPHFTPDFKRHNFSHSRHNYAYNDA